MKELLVWRGALNWHLEMICCTPEVSCKCLESSSGGLWNCRAVLLPNFEHFAGNPLPEPPLGFSSVKTSQPSPHDSRFCSTWFLPAIREPAKYCTKRFLCQRMLKWTSVKVRVCLASLLSAIRQTHIHRSYSRQLLLKPQYVCLAFKTSL